MALFDDSQGEPPDPSRPRAAAQVGQSAARAFDAVVASRAFQDMFDMRELWWRGWQDQQRRAQELLAPLGWLISPSLYAEAAKDILSLYESHGLDAVERELLSSFSPAVCRQVLDRLYDRASFVEWREALEEAYWAHSQGRYRVAIPIWVIAAEGVLSKELSTGALRRVDDIFTRVRKRDGKQIRDAFGLGEDVHDVFLEALLAQIGLLGRPKEDGQRMTNRHRLLHGEVPDVGSERESVQGILLLEVVHCCLGFRDEFGEEREEPSDG